MEFGRLKFYWTCIRPLYKWAAATITIMGALAVIQQQLLTRYAPSVANLAIWQILPDWNWQTWAVVVGLTIFASALEGAYRYVKTLQAELSRKGRKVTLLDAFGSEIPASVGRRPPRPTGRLIAAFTLVASIALFFLLSHLFKGTLLKAPVRYYPLPLTMRILYDTDFPYATMSIGIVVRPTTHSEASYTIPVREILNFDDRSKFLSFFVPFQSDSEEAYQLIGAIALTGYEAAIDQINSTVAAGTSRPGGTGQTWSKDLINTDQVYVYYENDLSLSQLDQLEQVFRQQGLSPEFLGHTYLVLHWNEKRKILNTVHEGEAPPTP
jgi:hypothetical protein